MHEILLLTVSSAPRERCAPGLLRFETDRTINVPRMAGVSGEEEKLLYVTHVAVYESCTDCDRQIVQMEHGSGNHFFIGVIMIAGCANDRLQFRYLVNSSPHKTQCRERTLIVRIVGTSKKTVSVRIRSPRTARMKLTHHKTFDVLDTCLFHRSAG